MKHTARHLRRELKRQASKPAKRPAPMRDAVLAALAAHGSMSISDTAQVMNLPRANVASAVASARQTHPGKCFRIVGYVWQEAGPGREIPLYSAQGGVDKPRPQAGQARHNAQKRAHYQRHKARINAKAAAKRAQRRGGVANPWAQLAPPALRAYMTKTARATTPGVEA